MRKYEDYEPHEIVRMMEAGSGNPYLLEKVVSALTTVLIRIPDLRAAMLKEVQEKLRLAEFDVPGTYPEERWKKSKKVREALVFVERILQDFPHATHPLNG